MGGVQAREMIPEPHEVGVQARDYVPEAPARVYLCVAAAHLHGVAEHFQLEDAARPLLREEEVSRLEEGRSLKGGVEAGKGSAVAVRSTRKRQSGSRA